MNRQPLPLLLDEALATWPRWQPSLGAAPEVVRPMEGGFTNHNWLVETDQGLAVLRINSRNDQLYNIDRHREQAILQVVGKSGIGPAVWYCNPEMGVLVTGFVEGPTLDDSLGYSIQVAAQFANLRGAIQRLSVPLPRFNYWQHLCHYESVLDRLGVAVPEELSQAKMRAEDTLMAFQDSDWQPVLVHHDLNPANIICTENGFRVIDWEYAAMGHGGMDDPSCPEPAIESFKTLIDSYWWLIRSCLVKET